MNDVPRHAIVRHRHETRRRSLTIARIEQVTPAMRRLVLAGAELAGFTSLSPDDHVKLFLPGSDGARRDYTPRHYDAEAGELWVDFALHGTAGAAGPATEWARAAAVGDAAEIGGPRGSAVVPNDFDWWWLIGDETALPAIARRLKELPADTPATTVVAVTSAEDQVYLPERPGHRAIWVHRPEAAAADPAPLMAALAELTPPSGEGFVWMAGEAGVIRAVRGHVLDTLDHPPAWTKAAGYWVYGQADATEKY